MKRSASVLSSALLGLGLLTSVGAANAQTTLAGSAFTLSVSGNTAVNSIITVSVFLTTASATAVASISPNIAFDSTYFVTDPNAPGGQTSGFNAPSAAGTIFGTGSTFTTGGAKVQSNLNDVPTATAGLPTNYVGTYEVLGLAKRTGSGAPTFNALSNVFIGSYSLQVIAALPTTGSEIGFTSDYNRNSIVIPTVNQSRVNSTFLASYGRVTVGASSATPGPESVAVFAMGGVAPALAVLRRRRAKKN